MHQLRLQRLFPGSWVWDLSEKWWVGTPAHSEMLPTQTCGQKLPVIPNQGPQGKLNSAVHSATPLLFLSPGFPENKAQGSRLISPFLL